MGQEAGNFVIEVESGDVSKNLQITERLSDEEYASRLLAGSFEGMSHSTYGRFEGMIPTYLDQNGVYIDKDRHVYSYTFYILNNNAESLDLKATMFYSNVTNKLDSAIRVMTITEESTIKKEPFGSFFLVILFYCIIIFNIHIQVFVYILLHAFIKLLK